MKTKAMDEIYTHITVKGKPALYTEKRIALTSVPLGFHLYELRGAVRNPSQASTLEESVEVDFVGTVLSPTKIAIPPKSRQLYVKGKMESMGEDMSIPQFAQRHGITMSSPQFPLRSGLSDGSSAFYSQSPDTDRETGCAGHLRMYFDGSASDFCSSWFGRNTHPGLCDALREELTALLDDLRTQGPFQSRRHLQAYCLEQEGLSLCTQEPDVMGFTTESERYRYCLRCNPCYGDYNGYLYVYDKQAQTMDMDTKPPTMTMGGM